MSVLYRSEDPLHFIELRNANAKRCPEFGHAIGDLALDEWLTCVVEEVGEIGRVLHRRRLGKLSHNEAKAKLADEIGDVVAYLDLLAARAGIDLGEAVRSKFNSVSFRMGSKVTLYEGGR